MKNVLVLLAAALVISSCNNSAKTSGDAGEVKNTAEGAAVYTIDAANSSVRWEGAKITETVHYGLVSIAEGSLSLLDGTPDAGSFTIDMNSITNQDLADAEYNAKLVGHLKSADFFMTETFPTAKFEISSVAASTAAGSTHTVTGNLTIKDVTKSISFPATFEVSENALSASATITINRNEWGIVWGGSLTDQSIKDYLQNNLIKDEITFQVNLKANKQ